MRQIKLEFERNLWLKELFPDLLWSNPRKESPKWSEDEGIVVKRKGNPKEATVEAWGLVDGQPTSKHFGALVYDDIVTRESVTTPDMIAKVTAAWELSTNIGSMGGIRRFAGTIYHFSDTYAALRKKGVATPRIYPATKDGTVDGEPVLLSIEALAQKRKDQGPYTFGCQMLLNPVADGTQNFKREWLRFYAGTTGQGMVKALMVDPASAKKKGSDYTAAFVVGFGQDNNLYILDIVRDRLNLSQRTSALPASGMAALQDRIREVRQRRRHRSHPGGDGASGVPLRGDRGWRIAAERRPHQALGAAVRAGPRVSPRAPNPTGLREQAL